MTQFDVKSAGSIADLEGYRLRVVNRLWDFLDSVADGELATDRDVNTHGGEVLRYTLRRPVRN